MFITPCRYRPVPFTAREGGIPLAQAVTAEVPLSIEPVVGWRVWYLARVEGELALISRMCDARWPPRAVMRAGCTLEEHEGTIPLLTSSCGLYAASSPTALVAARQFGGQPSVVGTVAMWGTVVEHERGARAQFAYPSRLRLVCAICLAKGRGARDPRVVGVRGDRLTAACRRHRAAVKDRTPARRVQTELLATYGIDVLPLGDLGASLRDRSIGGARRLRSKTGPQLAAAGAVWFAKALVGTWIAFCGLMAILMFAGIVWGAALGVVHGPLFVGPTPSPPARSPAAASTAPDLADTHADACLWCLDEDGTPVPSRARADDRVPRVRR